MKKHRKDAKESEKKKKRPKKAKEQRLLPAPTVFQAIEEAGQPLPSRSIETYRTLWQYGQWQDLSRLTETEIKADADRAKLAAIVAAAHSHLDDEAQARQFSALALKWGCDRRLLARLMISAATNSLARCAASLNEPEQSELLFQDAIRLVEPRADAKLLGRTRQIRETARLGLLPESLALLEADFERAQSEPENLSTRISHLQRDLDALKRGLVPSLNDEM